MKPYAEKWIKIGLKTGETDWKTFDKYFPICYEKAKLKYPDKVIRVQSPIVGGLAAAIAEAILKKRRAAVGDANRSAVNGMVSSAIRGVVSDAVYVAVRDVVDRAVGGAVDVAVDGVVGAAVHGAVSDAVGGAVSDAVDAVDAAVHGVVGDAVDEVDGAVDDAVDSAVRAAVDAVDSVVDDARKKLNLSWHYWLGGQFWVGWGGFYWSSVSFVNFFLDVCNLELPKDVMERVKAHRKVCESVNYIWPNKDFVMVCARPIKINRNDKGRLHSLTEKSIEYPDGWGLYHIDGIRFDENLWRKVVKKELSAKECVAIQNTDQRAIALRLLGWDKVLSELGAKKISEDEYGELFECDLKDDIKPARFVKAIDPSTNEPIFDRCHPDCQTPKEANERHYRLALVNEKYENFIRT